jgi:hypothetical protein
MRRLRIQTLLRRSHLLAALLVAASAGSASAETRTIGQIAPPGSNGGCFGCTEFQIATAPSSPSYDVPPGRWTVTSWTSQGGTTDSLLRLRVFRPGPAAGEYTVLAESAEMTVPAGASPPFATSLPVQGGDLIGVRTGTSAGTPASTWPMCGGIDGGLINIAATITAPDAPPSPPSNSFSVAKVKRDRQNGTATLTVDVPGPGTLDLSGTGVKSQRAARVARAIGARPVAAAGPVDLKLKAKGKARKRLRKHGKAKVKVAVTYTPTGGQPNTQPLRVKLLRKRQHS